MTTWQRLVFPPVVEGRGAAALLILRVIAGYAFMLHGWPKIQHPFGWMGPDSTMPGILQALAALAEFGGGLAWIIGLLVPLASFGILCTMVVAAQFHIAKGDPFVGRGGSYELATIYLVVSLLFILMGPGRYALDSYLFAGKADKAREPS